MALNVGTRQGDASLRDDSFVAPPLAGLVIYQVTVDPGMAPELRAATPYMPASPSKRSAAKSTTRSRSTYKTP